MKIGLDLSSLQNAHRMRGIGYTLINFINNLPPDLRQKHSFVFYFDREDELDNPLDILKLDGLNYEVRPLQKVDQSPQLKLPGKLNVLVRLLNVLRSSLRLGRGDARITDTAGIDVFLQTDQMIMLPRRRGLKKVFIAYDLIPYVLEWDYLWNYTSARSHGLPLQAALRCSARRWQYLRKLRVNTKMADKILSISDVTESDFLKYIPASKNKIITVPLGVNIQKTSDHKIPDMVNFIPSSWGYLRRPFVFDTSVPFLLFVGGADKRRKLDELVTAFNHLRGQGYNLKLVLAGDSMQGPKNISTEIIQTTLLDSSYLDDIIFMGFVNDEQRDWLYKNALAFVFPSRYEGFGLPVLEAFSYGTPVISYPNAATIEVAGNAAIYANNPLELIDAVKKLMKLEDRLAKKQEHLRHSRAENFSWQKTSQRIIAELEGVL